MKNENITKRKLISRKLLVSATYLLITGLIALIGKAALFEFMNPSNETVESWLHSLGFIIVLVAVQTVVLVSYIILTRTNKRFKEWIVKLEGVWI